MRCNRIYYTADVTAGKKVFDLERYFRDNHDRIVETKNMPLYSYISDTKRYNVMNLVSLDGNQPLIKVRNFAAFSSLINLSVNLHANFPSVPRSASKRSQ